MTIAASKLEAPTIDCSLVTVGVGEQEFGFDTSSKIEIEPEIEDTDAVRLIVKGVLRAQKKKQSTLVGHQITLTDNVFNPELVLALQGGTISYDTTDTEKIIGYTPPVSGSADTGETFTLNVYTAQYDVSGAIVNYELISYPNCTGEPVAFGVEDGSFRAPEYTIDSAPNTGQAPYTLTYVDTLPTLS